MCKGLEGREAEHMERYTRNFLKLEQLLQKEIMKDVAGDREGELLIILGIPKIVLSILMIIMNDHESHGVPLCGY